MGLSMMGVDDYDGNPGQPVEYFFDPNLKFRKLLTCGWLQKKRV
jgi:hypothetical protein